jgi:putative glutathione S-transferase
VRISVLVLLAGIVDWGFMLSVFRRVRAVSGHFSKAAAGITTTTGGVTITRPSSRTTMVSFQKKTNPPLTPLSFPKTPNSNTNTQDKKDDILHWVAPNDKSGEFKRQQSVFRSWIENKPDAEFPAEKGRYHLYVSYACPWAHRTLIVRKLKGLEEIVPFTSVHWHMGEKGENALLPHPNRK